MIADAVFYRDLAYVFVAAVLGGVLARLSGQPLILGYVFGGILISPLTPGPAVTDIHSFELFAEIGVILLMFSIGIEFSLRDLLRVKWVATIGGPLGILLSIGLALGAGTLLGWSVLQSVVIGMVVSVASTMVLARLLMDRGELTSRHGRIMIGITLVEDLAVVVLPVRDTFVALFFVTMGALINPAAVVAHPEILVVLIGLILLGKFVIWTAVVWLFGHPLWTATLVGVGLTQIGEFSFILIQVARSAGHVGDDMYQATLAASLLTILANAALMRTVPRWIGRMRLKEPKTTDELARRAPLRDHVVLCGFGRVGSAVGEALQALQAFQVSYVAIETDAEIVKGLRTRGVACVFGDSSERGILETVGTRHASLVMVTLPDIEPRPERCAIECGFDHPGTGDV